MWRLHTPVGLGNAVPSLAASSHFLADSSDRPLTPKTNDRTRHCSASASASGEHVAPWKSTEVRLGKRRLSVDTGTGQQGQHSEIKKEMATMVSNIQGSHREKERRAVASAVMGGCGKAEPSFSWGQEQGPVSMVLNVLKCPVSSNSTHDAESKTMWCVS